MPKINTALYPTESPDITFLTAQFPPSLYMRKEDGVFSGDQQAPRNRIILASIEDRHPDPLQPGEGPSVHKRWPGFERNRQISLWGWSPLTWIPSSKVHQSGLGRGCSFNVSFKCSWCNSGRVCEHWGGLGYMIKFAGVTLGQGRRWDCK